MNSILQDRLDIIKGAMQALQGTELVFFWFCEYFEIYGAQRYRSLD